MSRFSAFFKPSFKKLGWFFLVFFVAQVYSSIIIFYIPFDLAAGFIEFVLSPATPLFLKLGGVEQQLAMPLAATINVAWQYFLGTLLAKEISKDKE